MERFRKHLTFANVVSLMALFIALGGTAFGLARNSVGSKQIRNKAVKKVDLHKNSVTFPKVANNAIGSNEVQQDSINGGDINEASLDSTIQRSLTSGCPIGQAIGSISPGGVPECALIPAGVTLAGIQAQINSLFSQLGALAPQVGALCGPIRGQIESNFDAQDAASLPLLGGPIGTVALPNLANDLPACP
jgi:hypothetical protein